MPEIRHYIVTQTRQVKVWANNASDAGQIGTGAFENHKPHGVEGGAESTPRIIGLTVEEDH